MDKADQYVFAVDCIDRIVVPIVLFYFVFAPLLFRGTVYQSILLGLSVLFLLKWMFGVSNCTYGYLECRLRQCSRNNGWINHFVQGVYQGGESLGPVYIGMVASAAMWSV